MAAVVCCPLLCLGMVALSCMETAVSARVDFQAMRMKEQTKWILDYLRTHSCHITQAQVKYTFILGTATVCLGAWRLVLGISASRLNDLVRKYEGEIPLKAYKLNFRTMTLQLLNKKKS